jgi:hypothetical protein
MATKKKTAAKRPAPRKKKTATKPREFCKPLKGPHPACDPVHFITPAEAIYSFLGFLTTRDKEVILSKHNDVAPVAQLAGEFIKANNLPAVSDTWPNWIAPPNTEHLTNVPEVTMGASIAREALSADAAREQMWNTILGMSAKQQDAAIAGFLAMVQKQRNNRVENMQRVIIDVSKDMEDALASVSALNSVLRGEFVVVKSENNG